MTKEEVLKISGLTAEQKAAVERWYKAPFNKGKELEGTTTEIKKKLSDVVTKFKKNQENKEKKGTYTELKDLIDKLCKGTRQQKAMYTYNEVIEILNKATEEKQRALEQLEELKAQYNELAAKAGKKRIK